MNRALLWVLALAIPAPLAAQAGITVSSFAASDDGLAGSPVLLGLGVTHETGWLALRGAGAVDANSTPLGSAPAGGGLRVVSADVDGLLYFGSPAGQRSLIPYALAGVGARVLGGASSGTGLFWSYGGGVRTPLNRVLSLEGEVRYREPLANAGRLPADMSAGLEVRAGASVRVRGFRPRVVAPVPVPASRPIARPSEAPSSSAAAARLRVAERALDTADDYLGTRYQWGGNTPDEGFDCSGFVKFVFARQGIQLPRVSRDQARAGSALPLDLNVLEPGDLIAFAPNGGEINHIAIYAGNGRIIHSSSSGRGVRIDDLHGERGRWYRTHMVAARRVIDGPVLWGARE